MSWFANANHPVGSDGSSDREAPVLFSPPPRLHLDRSHARTMTRECARAPLDFPLLVMVREPFSGKRRVLLERAPALMLSAAHAGSGSFARANDDTGKVGDRTSLCSFFCHSGKAREQVVAVHRTGGSFGVILH